MAEKKQTFKKAFQQLLKLSASTFEEALPKDMNRAQALTVRDAMVNAQIIKALKGDIHSFGLIREIIGEKTSDEKEKEIIIKLEDNVKELSN